ncbi:MAG: cell wall hydrolase [Lachnospiraceae bacterium]
MYRKFCIVLIALNLLFLLLCASKDGNRKAWMHFLLNGTYPPSAVESSGVVLDSVGSASESTDDILGNAGVSEKMEDLNPTVLEPTLVITGEVTGTPLTIVCDSLEKQYIVELSQEERTMLERIVEAEAGGEDIQGKILVANVVLNRLKSSHFPDTIEGVIFQHQNGVYQFSPIRDGRYYTVVVSEESKDAVERALLGEDESRGAMYFMARNAVSNEKASWFDNSLTRLFSYGGHEFYASM